MIVKVAYPRLVRPTHVHQPGGVCECVSVGLCVFVGAYERGRGTDCEWRCAESVSVGVSCGQGRTCRALVIVAVSSPRWSRGRDKQWSLVGDTSRQPVVLLVMLLPPHRQAGSRFVTRNNVHTWLVAGPPYDCKECMSASECMFRWEKVCRGVCACLCVVWWV